MLTRRSFPVDAGAGLITPLMVDIGLATERWVI